MRTTVLLIPVRYGDPMPEITYDKGERKAVVKWKDQEDHLHLSEDNNRTRLKIKRVNGAATGIAESL